MAGLLLTHLAEVDDRPRREPPAIAEVIEPQHALDQHQRVLRGDVPVLLVDILEECYLEAAGAVVEGQNHAGPPLLDLIDQPSNADELAAAEAHGLRARRRSLAHQVTDPMRGNT